MIKINNKKNKGITLVALIVTIIILLILAGITINSLTQSGLFGKAKEATEEYSKSEAMEKVQIEVLSSYDNDGVLNLGKLKENITGNIKDAVIEEKEEFPITVTADEEKFIVKENGEVSYNGKGDITPVTPEDPIEKIKNIILSTTDNTILTDLYGNSITVPAGFKVKVDDDTNNVTTVDKGIVIIDENENEFVWIPVPKNGKIYTDIARTEANAKTVELNRYIFDTNGNPNAQNDEKIIVGIGSFEELQTSPFGYETAKSITNYKNSVRNNKGYYIGRYEARTEKARSSATDQITTITEKGTDSVYNWVTHKQAAGLAKKMYDETKPFESDLMNSYAWDTATLFLQRCGSNSKYSLKTTVNSSLAPTGTNNQTTKDVECNVYDMASNILELTTEVAYYNSEVSLRGGFLDCSAGYIYSPGARTSHYNDAYSQYGFRPILYLQF